MTDLDLCAEIAELLGWTSVVPDGDWLSGRTPQNETSLVPRWSLDDADAGRLLGIAARMKLVPLLTACPNLAFFECYFEPVGWDKSFMYGFSPVDKVDDINQYLRRSSFPSAVANAMYVALCARCKAVPELTRFV